MLLSADVRYLSITFIITLLSLAVQPVQAQQANYELAERFTSQKMEKMSSSIEIDPHWIEDQNRFWYSYEKPSGKFWYFVDAEEGTKRPLFDRQKMAAQLTETLNRTFNHKELSLKDFEFNTKDQLFTFHVDSINFTYDVENSRLMKRDSLQDKSDDWATYSPDSSWVAYAKNHNLYLMRTDDPDSTEYQLTKNGERWYSFQEDAGDTTSNKKMESIAEWFEDSSKLYARRTDTRKVNKLWVIETDNGIPLMFLNQIPKPGKRKCCSQKKVTLSSM